VRRTAAGLLARVRDHRPAARDRRPLLELQRGLVEKGRRCIAVNFGNRDALLVEGEHDALLYTTFQGFADPGDRVAHSFQSAFASSVSVPFGERQSERTTVLLS